MRRGSAPGTQGSVGGVGSTLRAGRCHPRPLAALAREVSQLRGCLAADLRRCFRSAPPPPLRCRPTDSNPPDLGDAPPWPRPQYRPPGRARGHDDPGDARPPHFRPVAPGCAGEGLGRAPGPLPLPGGPTPWAFTGDAFWKSLLRLRLLVRRSKPPENECVLEELECDHTAELVPLQRSMPGGSSGQSWRPLRR